MKLKSTLLALALSLGFAANATLPQTYLNETLPATNISSAGWTASVEGVAQDGRDYFSTTSSVTFTKTYSTSVDITLCEDFTGVFFVYSYNSGAVDGKIEFFGADDNNYTLTFDADKFNTQSEYSQTLTPSSVSGTKSKQVNKIVVTLNTKDSEGTDFALGGIFGASGDKLPIIAGRDFELNVCDYDAGENAFKHVWSDGEAYDESKYGHCGYSVTNGGGYRNEVDADGITMAKYDEQGGVYTLYDCGRAWDKYRGYIWDADGNASIYTLSDGITVTREMAAIGFGQWFKYTIDAKEDLTCDISIKGGAHWGSYGVISLGNKAYTKEAGKDGGCKLDFDPNFDWAKNYTAAVVFSLDGTPLKNTQKARPVNTGSDAAAYTAIVADQSKWTSTLVNGEANDTLWFFPNDKSVNGAGIQTWRTWYHSDKTGEPDYKGVKLTKGTHVFKLQVLCSQVQITTIKFENVTSTTGVSDVTKDAEEAATVNAYGTTGAIVSDVAAEVYSVTGAYVGKVNGTIDVPAGVYVVKAGNAAKKVLVK